MNADSVKFYRDLNARVDEILHYVWDPIGVSGIAMARDEYSSYVPAIVKMLLERRKEDAISLYLHHIEGEQMGLGVGSRPSTHVDEVAKMLVDHYETLKIYAEKET